MYRKSNLKVFSPLLEGMTRQIEQKRGIGKDSTADLYRAVCNWLESYLHGKDIDLRQFSPSNASGFMTYLKRQNRLSTNTLHTYLSGLRAMYNRMLHETGFIPRIHPFSGMKIRREKTVKRALPGGIMERIPQLKFQQKTFPGQELAADLCSFSFMACGIPFVDLAHLTCHNIEGDTLVYHRTKTNTLIRLKITAGMRMLIGKYAGKTAEAPNSYPYLFPILSGNSHHNTYEYYKSRLRRYNNSLKTIGRRIGIGIPLTSYVIRHTWATEAYRHHVPISVISQALGHTTEKTTRFYLDELDISELARANQIVSGKIEHLLLRKGVP